MAAFKAIIIGGGVVGLSMAHALHLAHIDFVLVESRDAIGDGPGVALTLMPDGARILQQLGLLAAVRDIAAPVHGVFHTSGREEQWRDSSLDHLADALGYPTMLVDSSQLASQMLRALPGRERKVRTGKTLVAVDSSSGGVAAMFDDGTVETGSIIIGADGARSSVRRLMSELDPNPSPNPNPERFSSDHRCLSGYAPRPEALRAGEILERHGDGWGIQVLSRGDWSFFAVYEELAKAERREDDDNDDAGEGFARGYLSARLDGGVTFGDLWRRRFVAREGPLEQGVCGSWSVGRVVLVGDSAHKPLPGTGVSGSIGIESAAVLANQLCALVQVQREPTMASLNRAFSSYQAQREDQVRHWVNNSLTHLKLLTWDTEEARYLFKELARAGMRGSGHGITDTVFKKFARAMRMANKLDYAPIRH